MNDIHVHEGLTRNMFLNTLKTFDAFSTVSMKISLMREGMEGWGLHVQIVEPKIYKKHFSTNFTNLVDQSQVR